LSFQELVEVQVELNDIDFEKVNFLREEMPD